jgi:hypothetical protein
MADFFNVHDFGAVGDGLTDDAAAIRAAITEAAGRTVLFDSNKKYLIKSAITHNGDVFLKSNGANKAIIFQNGQLFDSLVFNAEPIAPSKTLAASMQRGNRGWKLNNITGIAVGMLMEVKSSASWYYDPRPTTTDARKSELHRVASIDGNTVYTEDRANDGYNLTTETVEITFINPINVHIENLTIQCVLPATPFTSVKTALTVTYASEARFLDVDTIDSASQGIMLIGCYNPKIVGGKSVGQIDTKSGYGVHIWGCSNTIISERRSWGCRIGIDIGGKQIISRDTLIEKCTVTGGGVASNGIAFIFDEDGKETNLISQKGFTTHGAVDHIKYVNNTVTDLYEGFNTIARNISYFDNFFLGRFRFGINIAGTGENFWIRNNRSYDGWSNQKDGSTYSGTIDVNQRRLDYFLTISNTVQNVLVDSNDMQVERRFVRIFGNPGTRIRITNNTVEFASKNPDEQLALINTNADDIATVSDWIISDNFYTRIGGNFPVALTKNIILKNCIVSDAQSFSGPYDPVIALGNNTTSATARNCQFSRVGNLVTATGTLFVKPIVANKLTTVRITLPVPSKFSEGSQCAGTVSAWDGSSGAVSAYSPTNNLQITFSPKTTDELDYRFTCMYQVL